ncbi:MAG: cyclase family protein [Gammaproteobacteria bacterium]
MFKKTLISLSVLGCMAAAGVISAQECSQVNWQACAGKPWVDGDTMDTPLGSKWWPHPLWGADDEAGSTNWYTKPEVVMRALSQVKEGKTYKLGFDYYSEMPLFGARSFALRIPGTPNGGPFGANKVIWHDDYLATEVGQVGTQFDGLGHIGVQLGKNGDRSEMRFYNGHVESEFATAYGLTKLGTEKLHPIIARGVLIDFAGARGVDALEIGECMSVDDIKMALEKQGMADFEFMEGDAVLFRYGWEMYWENDPDKFNEGTPGLCAETAYWLADQKIGVTGGDHWNATDPVPYPNGEACAFCIHQILQTRNGIVNQENLRLKQLADDGTYVFAYIYSPTPIRGATGSMGSPIAIK